MKKEFLPMEIGLPNTEKEKAIVNFYSKLCQETTRLLWDLEVYLDCFDELKIERLFEFLNAVDPREFLYIAWMKKNNVEIPMALSIEKIIELDLIEAPREVFTELIQQRASILKLVRQSKEETKFFFPLQKLFDDRLDYRGFSFTDIDQNGFISEEFDKALHDHVRIFTETQEENEILNKINQFVDLMNEFVSVGLMPQEKHRWEHYLNANLINNLVFTQGEEKPFSINKQVTNRLVLRKNLLQTEKPFSKKPFSKIYGSPADILKFEHEDIAEC